MISETGWYVLDTDEGVYLVCKHTDLHPEDLTPDELVDAFEEGVESDNEEDAIHHAQEMAEEELDCELGVYF